MQKGFWCCLFCIAVCLCNACNVVPPAPKPDYTEPGVTLESKAVGGLTTQEVNLLVDKLAKEQYFLPKNARFDDGGKIVSEIQGQQVNVQATVQTVMAAKPYTDIAVVREKIMPEITTQKLANATSIGSYTSQILDSKAGRLNNIRLTAKLMNNKLIRPREEFSFNLATGEPTPERGFQKAIVYQDHGKLAEELGGGMCQVSSTLYNAVLQAGLPVVERHAHSKPVNYVPSGKDATTYSDKDFRFINSSRYLLILKAYEHDLELTVEVLQFK